MNNSCPAFYPFNTLVVLNHLPTTILWISITLKASADLSDMSHAFHEEEYQRLDTREICFAFDFRFRRPNTQSIEKNEEPRVPEKVGKIPKSVKKRRTWPVRQEKSPGGIHGQGRNFQYFHRLYLFSPPLEIRLSTCYEFVVIFVSPRLFRVPLCYSSRRSVVCVWTQESYFVSSSVRSFSYSLTMSDGSWLFLTPTGRQLP